MSTRPPRPGQTPPCQSTESDPNGIDIRGQNHPSDTCRFGQNFARVFARVLPLFDPLRNDKPLIFRGLPKWRRGRDSNPRDAFGVYPFSKRALSATQPPLRVWSGGNRGIAWMGGQTVARKDCGDPGFQARSSPGTRPNSRRLRVARGRPRLRAWAAMSMSIVPMRRPERSKPARRRP